MAGAAIIRETEARFPALDAAPARFASDFPPNAAEWHPADCLPKAMVIAFQDAARTRPAASDRH